jgi:UDP-N-acetylmuramate--alanine ligase
VFLESLHLSAPAIIKEHEPLGIKTTLRVGGTARYYIQPADENDIIAIIKQVHLYDLPYFVLGRGSNVLIQEGEYPGVVIHLTHAYWQSIERVDDLHLWAGAGTRLKTLCGQVIPGSVGGALRMNAGAMGGWMFDVVEKILVLLPEGILQTFDKKDLTIGYRTCDILKEGIALRALLKGQSCTEKTRVQSCMEHYAHQRKSSQPREPSAGCIFKNPPGDYAGRLIDTAGLKGYRIGGAQVSSVHGNFIVNTGHATATDILELISHIQKVVYAQSGVQLTLEVQMLKYPVIPS